MDDLLDKNLKHWVEAAADAIEKLLKALHQQKRNEPAPPLHNLFRLANLNWNRS